MHVPMHRFIGQILQRLSDWIGTKAFTRVLGSDTWLYIRLRSLQAWYLGIASFEFVLIVLLVLLAFTDSVPSRLIPCKRIGVLSRLVELEESIAENSTILMHLFHPCV